MTPARLRQLCTIMKATSNIALLSHFLIPQRLLQTFRMLSPKQRKVGQQQESAGSSCFGTAIHLQLESWQRITSLPRLLETRSGTACSSIQGSFGFSDPVCHVKASLCRLVEEWEMTRQATAPSESTWSSRFVDNSADHIQLDFQAISCSSGPLRVLWLFDASPRCVACRVCEHTMPFCAFVMTKGPHAVHKILLWTWCPCVEDAC